MTVVAIDLDGVLRIPNALTGGERRPDVFEVEITMRRDAFPSYTHTEPPWDEAGQWTGVHTFSGAGVRWLQDLLARNVEVVWATRWNVYANMYFAPAMGLPRLPVAVRFDDRRDDEWWSQVAQELSRKFDGQPLLWVSTLVAEAHPRLAERRRGVDRALTRSYLIPEPQSGITGADAAAMDEWLALTASEYGREELRRRRRRMLAVKREEARRARWTSDVLYVRWRHVQARLAGVLDDDSALRVLLADYVAAHPEGVDPHHVVELRKDWGAPEDPPAERLLERLREPTG